MNKKTFLYYFGIIFLFCFCQTQTGSDVLSDLAQALTILHSDSQQPDGQWISKKYPETLLEAKNNIYRFKVLQQTGVQCAFHAQRNLVFMFKILTSPKSQFGKLYRHMKNQNSYEDFKQATREQNACFKHFTIPELIKFKKDFPLSLPAIPDELSSIFVNYTTTQKQKVSQDFFPKKDRLKPEDIDDLTPFWNFNTYKELIKPIKNFYTTTNAIIGFDLSTVGEKMGHATTLVVTQQNGKNEYFFADSFNSPLSAPAKKIIELFENEERLKRALLRLTYKYLTDATNSSALLTKTENLISKNKKTEAIQQLSDAKKHWQSFIKALRLDKTNLHSTYNEAITQEFNKLESMIKNLT